MPEPGSLGRAGPATPVIDYGMTVKPYARTASGLDICVRLTPKSSDDRVNGVWIDAEGRAWLVVRVSAAPESGKANAALIKLLAKRLGVAQSAIRFASGETHRLKRLRVAGDPAALARAFLFYTRSFDRDDFYRRLGACRAVV